MTNKEAAMNTSNIKTIVSEITRIDSSPNEIKQLYEELGSNLGVIAPVNKRLLAERKKLI